MAKKTSTFRLSDTTKEMLKKLAKKERRSEAMILELLIEQAAKKELPVATQ